METTRTSSCSRNHFLRPCHLFQPCVYEHYHRSISTLGHLEPSSSALHCYATAHQRGLSHTHCTHQLYWSLPDNPCRQIGNQRLPSLILLRDTPILFSLVRFSTNQVELTVFGRSSIKVCNAREQRVKQARLSVWEGEMHSIKRHCNPAT